MQKFGYDIDELDRNLKYSQEANARRDQQTDNPTIEIKKK